MTDSINLRRRRPKIKQCIVCGMGLGLDSRGTDETICKYCKEHPLKPCPFCGGPAKIHRRRACFWTVCCRDTRCPGHNINVTYDSRNEATLRWNRRHYENSKGDING